jgi:hypothetical protein
VGLFLWEKQMGDWESSVGDDVHPRALKIPQVGARDGMTPKRGKVLWHLMLTCSGRPCSEMRSRCGSQRGKWGEHPGSCGSAEPIHADVSSSPVCLSSF